MFQDPANILVFVLMGGFFILVIYLKKMSDKADQEEKMKKGK